MPHFRIPDGAKPSKVASKDETRPILTQGNIRQRDGEWVLEVTDSYCLSIIPLTVREGGDSMIRAGLVSRDVLLAVEKPKCGGFGFNADDTVTIYGQHSAVMATLPNAVADGPFPNTDWLVNGCPAKNANGGLLRIGLNPQLLAAIAAAQGRKNSLYGGPVVLEVDTLAASGSRYLRPILVKVGESENLLMPARIN